MDTGLSAVLDVMLGLTFVFLLFALIASLINEWVAKILSWRAKTLKAGVENLLNDPGGQELVGLLFDHSLIRSLGRPKPKTDKPESENGRVKRGPSYIPSSRFAQALSETIAARAETDVRMRGVRRDGVLQTRHVSSEAPARQPGREPTAADSGTPFTALSAVRFRHELLNDARKLVATLPDGDLRQTLTALADRVQGDLKAFESSVAAWFDDSMDRVSGWYQRKCQIALAIISLALAVVLNLDALHVAKTLWQQQEMRQALVEAATEFQQQRTDQPTEAKALRAQIDELAAMPMPLIGWVGVERRFGDWFVKLHCPGDATLRRGANDTLECVKDVALGFAQAQNTRRVQSELDPQDLADMALESIGVILGWLISGAAISLGAPFWFNALERLLKIRGAGRKPDQKTSQASEPATPRGTS